MRFKKKVWGYLAVVLFVVFFYQAFIGANSVQSQFAGESLKAVEDSIRRAAVQCYATEGSYPPDLDYLVKHYGLLLNEEEFFFHYEVIASNIMPNIMVIRR